jgi:chromosomal replication initiation ATPase DnaA
MNLSQTRGQRWYYPEGTVKENIKQAGFDLRKNSLFCILSHQDDNIRRLKVDQEKLEVAANQMESRLTEIAAQLDMP